MNKIKGDKNKGITLIALVITIIILLILVGVSMAMLSGENGILNRAKEAREETKQAEKEEKTNLARTEDIINEYIDGVEVEQVTDEQPGVLEVDETNSNIYVINSIEDLVVFAYNVRKGNTYVDDIVKLGLTLDFNSTKSYVDPFRTDYGEYGYNGELKTLLTSGEGFLPIGTTSNIDKDLYSFAGTFEGNNKEIRGLYINTTQIPTEEKRVGLFGSNNGIIQNLGIDNGNISLTMNGSTCDIGGIVAKNYNTINNCHYTGKINMYAENTVTGLIRVGGIVSGNDASISKSYYNGEIYIESKATTSVFSGGISSGNSTESSSISQCFTKGNITLNDNGDSLIEFGGITSYNYKIIENCYNSMDILVNKEISDNAIYQGGIIGVNAPNGTINNCYNIGVMKTTTDENERYIGGLCGIAQKTSTINNSYCLNTTANEAIEENRTEANYESVKKTESEMKDMAFVDLLNQTNSNMWKRDINNINNGYPVFDWQ